jgi:hypothetical protein
MSGFYVKKHKISPLKLTSTIIQPQLGGWILNKIFLFLI